MPHDKIHAALSIPEEDEQSATSNRSSFDRQGRISNDIQETKRNSGSSQYELKRVETLPDNASQTGTQLRRTMSTTSAAMRANKEKKSWFHNLSSKFHHSPSASPAAQSPAMTPEAGLSPASTPPPTGRTIEAGAASTGAGSGTILSSSSHRLSRTLSYSAASIGEPLARSKTLPASPSSSRGEERKGEPILSPAAGTKTNPYVPINPFDMQRVSSPRVGVEPISPEMSPRSVSSKPEKGASSLVSKLRRISGKTPSPAVSGSSTPCPERKIYNCDPRRHTPDVIKLKAALPPRVSFAIEVMERDPPQQIPGRHPRVGNITFTDSGELKREPLPSGVMPPGATSYILPKNYAASTKSASQAAYEEAVRVAQSVRSSGFFKKSKNAELRSSSKSETESDIDDNEEEDEDVGVTKNNAAALKIDTPMHTGHVRASDDRPTGGINGEPSDAASVKSTKSGSEEDELDMSPEAVYTRCCHLREIMPITATLKQIRGRSAPLQVIKMMNPKPTMIEILALSDFLTIVPVCMVIFDNVTLSNDMVQIILAALVRSSSLNRLSLRNTRLDPVAWKAFCAFIALNKSLQRLDLSMQQQKEKQSSNKQPKDKAISADCSKASTPTIASTPPTRSPSQTPGITAPAPPPDRSHLNWASFTEALIRRSGIEELVLSGCMVPSEQLETLILKGCAISTKRLGLALNDLQQNDIQVLMQWVEQPSFGCQGLDLGGNDLSREYDFIKLLFANKTLQYISLNSTNLFDEEGLTSIFNSLSAAQPTSSSSMSLYKSPLKLIDLSSNPKLFPRFTATLANALPRFPNLRRIHLDSNNMSSEDIVRLATAFVRCRNLVHISILGNKLDSTACAALSVATHLSNSIYTIECDQDMWPAALQRRLAHYCMVNMEYMAGRISRESQEHGKQDEIDQEELMDAGNALAKATEELLRASRDEEAQRLVQRGYQEQNQNAVAEEMIKRAHEVRATISQTLEELFSKRKTEGLTDAEKEKLIRLCFLDGNLQKVLNQYSQLPACAAGGIQAINNADVRGMASALGGAGTVCGPKKAMAMHDPLLTLERADRNVALSATSESNPDLKVAPVEDEYIESLSRKSSSTSLHSLYKKQQEAEEGKIHKLGSFLRSYNTNGARESDEEGGDIQTDEHENLSITELIEKIEKLHGPEISRILEARENDTQDRQTLESVVDDIAKAWKKPEDNSED